MKEKKAGKMAGSPARIIGLLLLLPLYFSLPTLAGATQNSGSGNTASSDRFYCLIGTFPSLSEASVTAQEATRMKNWKNLRSYVSSTSNGLHQAFVGFFLKREHAERYCQLSKKDCVVVLQPTNIRPTTQAMKPLPKSSGQDDEANKPLVNARAFLATLQKELDAKLYSRKVYTGGRFHYELNATRMNWSAKAVSKDRAVMLEKFIYDYPRSQEFRDFAASQRAGLKSDLSFVPPRNGGDDYLVFSRTVALDGENDLEEFQKASIGLYDDLNAFFGAFGARDVAPASNKSISEQEFYKKLQPEFEGLFCTKSPKYYYAAFNRYTKANCQQRFAVAFSQCRAASRIDPASGTQWKSKSIDTVDENNANRTIMADCIRFYNSLHRNKNYVKVPQWLPVEKLVPVIKMKNPELLDKIDS